jgi:catechol 2,3-dioxygenase-like lactoylglutathione lyase family enzyme
MQIQRVTLATKHLRPQRDFYARVLGLEVVAETGSSVTLQIGRSTLTFEQDPNFEGLYHFAFDIPRNQVDEAEHWLRARVPLLEDSGGRSRFPPNAEWNTTNLYFDDAAGNIVEFIARHNLEHETQAAFGARSVLHISELGVVVPDVPAGVHHLKAAHGLHAFNGSSDTFTAVGGHNGMLIVVREGRGWFPVGRPAVPTAFELVHGQSGLERTLTQADLFTARAQGVGL